MSYQAIARKWRPKDFSQLVGQNHVARTLLNALQSGRLHHALLFTGPRGTGKTSTARILARAVRCPDDVKGESSEAQAIALGQAVDVIEIDGASNNGVDAVRELRDTIGYMPASGKFKVYIIDEVHMLSIAAFNALLKTLEEPPEHVIFILATTEIHKIPATILSRVQRYDFRRISTREISEHLEKICLQDGVEADKNALWLIAKEGDGSMRDAQSLLDLVMTYSAKKISLELTTEILGLSDRLILKELLVCLLTRNTQAIWPVLKKLSQTGAEPKRFLQETLELLRHILVLKSAGSEALQLVDLPEMEIQEWQNLSQNVSAEDLHLLFDMALKGCQDLFKAPDPQIALEMILLRMVEAPQLISIQKILANMQDSSAEHSAGKPAGAGPALTDSALPAVAASTAAAPQVGKASTEKLTEKWLDFVTRLKAVNPVIAAQLESLYVVAIAAPVVTVSIPEKMKFIAEKVQNPDFVRKVNTYLSTFWGGSWQMELIQSAAATKGTSARELYQQKEKQEWDDLRKQVENHPLVQSAKSHFNTEIKSIRPQSSANAANKGTTAKNRDAGQRQT